MTEYVYSWWQNGDCTENSGSMHTSSFKLGDECIGMDGLVEVFNITKDGDKFNVQTCDLNSDDSSKCDNCTDRNTLYLNKCILGESITTKDNMKTDSPNPYPATISYYNDFNSPPYASELITPDGKCNSMKLNSDPKYPVYTAVSIPYYIKNENEEGNLVTNCPIVDYKTNCHDGCNIILAKNGERINGYGAFIVNNSSYHCDKKTGTCKLQSDTDGYRTEEECNNNCSTTSSMIMLILIILTLSMPFVLWVAYKGYRHYKKSSQLENN